MLSRPPITLLMTLVVVLLVSLLLFAHETVPVERPIEVVTTSYILRLSWSNLDKEFGDYEVHIRLLQKANGRTLGEWKTRSMGLDEMLVNGSTSRVFELQEGEADYVVFSLSSCVAWRSNLVAWRIDRTSRKAMDKPMGLTYAYEAFCIDGGLIAYCDGWEVPKLDSPRALEDPLPITCAVRSLVQGRAIWVGGLCCNKTGKPMYRYEVGGQEDEAQRYLAYREELESALCIKLQEVRARKQ